MVVLKYVRLIAVIKVNGVGLPLILDVNKGQFKFVV